jgi:hypothetical protein
VFIFGQASNQERGQRVYWGSGNDTENTPLSHALCRRRTLDETKAGLDETTLPGDDNFLKPGLINQATTGSDKQTGPKRPK